MATVRAVQQIHVDGVVALALEGDVDEFLGPELFDTKACDYLVLDLARVHRVSSFGVREWIKHLNAASERYKEIFFVNVSVTMMDQFNMIQNFACGGVVLSFFVSYVCEECGSESYVLVDTSLDRQTIDSLATPDRSCTVCGGRAELDDDPAILFEFARSVHVPTVPREVSTFFRSEESWIPYPPGSRVRLKKTVSEDGTVFSIAGLVDQSFPTRSVVRGAEGTVQFDLAKCEGLSPDGVTRWHDTIQGLRDSDCNIQLVAVPPSMLRAFTDRPQLIADTALMSVALPIERLRSHALGHEIVSVDGLGDFLESAGETKNEDTAFRLRWEAILIRNLVLKAVAASNETPDEPTELQLEEQPNDADTDTRFIQVNPLSGKHEQPEVAATPDEQEGPYEIVCKIAQGGMAEVYLARFHGAAGFRRLAILKKILPEYATDSQLLKMFVNEARLAARLNHPNIVSILELGKAEGTYFISMEYIHGRDLRSIARRLRQKGRDFPAGFIAHFIADVASALARAHQPDPAGRRLIHGDVTPRNTLVSFEGVTKLLDFGLVRRSDTHRSSTASVIRGTPAFIAPEVLEGAAPGPSSDVWAAGVTFYSLLTGTNPFRAESQAALFTSILHADPVPPSQHRPDLDETWDHVVSRVLEKDPSKRYASAEELEFELRQLAGNTSDTKTRAALSDFMRDTFAEEVTREAKFIHETGQPAFEEALLAASPEQIREFFQSTRDHDATEAGTRELSESTRHLT